MGFPSECSRSGFIGFSGWLVALRAVERLAGEAGRSDALAGRWGWRVAVPGPGIGDERAVGAGWCLDGLFEQPVEQHPARAGAPAVEAEGELVQVGL
jgi:hypothetical protein